jgi:polysaccharide export outer membrane protein
MPHRILRIASLIFAVAAVMRTGVAQQPVRRAEPVAPPVATPANGTAAGNASYSAVDRAGMSATPVDANKRLSVGDVVSVEIVEDQEGAFQRNVTATGDIEVPPLGRVHVAGKSTADAEVEIKRKLEADYYYTATVRMAIDRINPVASLRKMLVSGEVRAPGTIEWPSSEKLQLSVAILRASGFTDWSDKEKVVLYRAKGGKSVYNVKDILEKGKAEEDPVLEEGDRVFVDKRWFRLKD